jgi:uncharacterized SAM-binding protein YcdF (DUF218 family)
MTDDQITDLLFVDDGPAPADLALVFGYVDPGGARQRARHAAALFHAGLVPRLLLSGGGSHRHITESEAGLMLRVVLDLGVPRDVILVEDRSRTTFENVSRSVALLGELDLLDAAGMILLVSCPWHMRRVSLIARAGFPDHVGLRCCPHCDSCTAGSWRTTQACRERVLGEAELLMSFIEAGILADPR